MGLTQIASQVEPFWNPYVEEQAISRADRIGQTRVVQVFKLFAPGEDGSLSSAWPSKVISYIPCLLHGPWKQRNPCKLSRTLACMQSSTTIAADTVARVHIIAAEM